MFREDLVRKQERAQMRREENLLWAYFGFAVGLVTASTFFCFLVY